MCSAALVPKAPTLTNKLCCFARRYPSESPSSSVPFFRFYLLLFEFADLWHSYFPAASPGASYKFLLSELSRACEQDFGPCPIRADGLTALMDEAQAAAAEETAQEAGPASPSPAASPRPASSSRRPKGKPSLNSSLFPSAPANDAEDADGFLRPWTSSGGAMSPRNGVSNEEQINTLLSVRRAGTAEASPRPAKAKAPAVKPERSWRHQQSFAALPAPGGAGQRPSTVPTGGLARPTNPSGRRITAVPPPWGGVGGYKKAFAAHLGEVIVAVPPRYQPEKEIAPLPFPEYGAYRKRTVTSQSMKSVDSWGPEFELSPRLDEAEAPAARIGDGASRFVYRLDDADRGEAARFRAGDVAAGTRWSARAHPVNARVQRELERGRKTEERRGREEKEKDERQRRRVREAVSTAWLRKFKT
jgi:hypothetical protein